MLKDKDGNYIDSKGNAVPAKYFSKLDKRRDRLVESVIRKAERLKEFTLKIKHEMFGQIDSFIQAISKENKIADNWKGNIEIMDISGRYKVIVQVSETLTFNEQLHVAKGLIDECIKDWSKGANDKIVVLINQAFQVDKKGKVDTRRILSLRTLKIKDKKWKDAMEKISEAIQVESSRRYLVFKKRNGNDGWENITVNFSSI